MALKFGTSGVRGLVTEMTDLECAFYTRAFILYLKAAGYSAAVTLAGDFRSSTPRILKAVAFAIEDEGLAVDFCGFIPTPALAAYALERAEAAIMVTGSHIPDDRNGIKFYMPSGEVLKKDEQEISRFYGRLKDKPAAGVFNSDGYLKEEFIPGLSRVNVEAEKSYKERYLKYFKEGALAGLKLVVYEHSSVARDILPDILAGLGAEVIRVGRSESFIPVDTEAVNEPERLAKWVADYGADALLTADGDGDRPLLVDENGRVVRGDILGILVAEYLNADAISTPVSCNTALEKSSGFDFIERTKIGSPHVIASMLKAAASGYKRVVGYEANGGFLTASDMINPETGVKMKALPTRDAALPLIAALLLAKERGKRLSRLIDELPPRFTSSGIIRNFPSEKGRAIVENFVQGGKAQADRYFAAVFGAAESIDLTDGARITFAGGNIVHLRPSGNAPEFRCYTESSTEEEALKNNRQAIEIIQRYAMTAQNLVIIARNIKSIVTKGNPFRAVEDCYGTTIARLDNKIQEYAWGSYTAIPELLGEPSPAETPQAELWMGAHHKAPSEVIMGKRKITLPELIIEDPASTLGTEVARKFNSSLPFLFKVLAMAEPLSIQAHPNLAQAIEGFARENEQNIPIDGFKRNYRDANHKPEILCALTTCWALKGFRPIEQIISIMAPLNIKGIAPLVEALEKNSTASGLRRFFGALLSLDQDSGRAAVTEVLAHIQHKPGNAEREGEPLWRWITRLNEKYPGDIGVLSPLFLNLVEVKPGEALFLQAGQLHAYLQGVGIELMANSDNVLRGGLTPKHIDAAELLSILDFKGEAPEKVKIETSAAGEKFYLTPAAEFRLSLISVKEGREYLSSRERSIEIIICTQGSASVRDMSTETGAGFPVKKGDSFIIPASVVEYRITGSAHLYKAAVPV